ncbi:MAG: sugar-transfer associated ATP-grasp domain-containing protein [Acutalibacteraceae bacterium]
MLRKIKIFFGRLKTMSFKTMFSIIDQIHDEFGKSKLITFIDMVCCALRFNVGYLDYHVFGFAKVKGKKRKTFMTMNQNLSLVRQVNDPDCYKIFDNKVLFFDYFKDFTGRGFLNLEGKTAEDLKRFCDGKKSVFAKQTETFGGQGITREDLSPETDYDELFKRLMNNRQYLIEDTIIQHEKMNELYPLSINTLRMVTLVKDGKANFMYALVRMGQKGAKVDNISSGGMYAPINEKGIITHGAFCDKEGICHDVHPTSGTKLIGFEIPYFKEAVELVKKAALVVDGMKYVGWDVAITPDGPILVEGNNFPSYDMVQNYRHRDGDEGIKAKFEEVMGIKL